jgi:chorismate dehydratase
MIVRLGAVGYLNARPLVYGLDRSLRFLLRFDVPSTCASLLHEGAIDIGLIPSIEYLRGGPYAIVPDLAIASRGRVASVLLFTSRPIGDVRSIAMDVSSRTSVALVRVLCARLYKISPKIEPAGPDLSQMLGRCDAALIIGDNALFQPPNVEHKLPIEAIDLGQAWADLTGLPFVYAFWAGRPGTLEPGDVEALQRARDAGVAASDNVACAYLRDTPERQAVGMRYLRENIRYHLGAEEQAGLELFYRYAAEIDVAPSSDGLRFF